MYNMIGNIGISALYVVPKKRNSQKHSEYHTKVMLDQSKYDKINNPNKYLINNKKSKMINNSNMIKICLENNQNLKKIQE